MSGGSKSVNTNIGAFPVNFKEISREKIGRGELKFVYTWESSTGPESERLSNLNKCDVGEIVEYDGAGDPFPLPSPPFANKTVDNPTIRNVLGGFGSAQDFQKIPGGEFADTLKEGSLKATQRFRYRCSDVNNGNWNPLLGPFTIRRSVVQNSDVSFKYTVTKDGISNFAGSRGDPFSRISQRLRPRHCDHHRLHRLSMSALRQGQQHFESSHGKRPR